jgi:hypothetical protein
MANFNVNSTETLEAALASADNDINITVTGDFSITSPINILMGKTVTIASNSTQRRLTRGVTGNLITLSEDSSLTLKNMILDGYKADYPDAGGQSDLRRGAGET